MQDVGAPVQELKAKGSWVFTGGLHPASTATVVRQKDGDVLTTDGPYAEGKEHMRLGREVAIRVLPEHFAADAERLKCG